MMDFFYLVCLYLALFISFYLFSENHEINILFTFIGKLLRPFPSENKIVQDIIEQLYDLIESGQGIMYYFYI
jgi:hypothetical protein